MRVFGYMLIIIVLQWIWLCIQYSIADARAGHNPCPVFKITFPAYLTASAATSSAVPIPMSRARGGTIPNMEKDAADFVFPMCLRAYRRGSATTITI